MNAPDLSPDPTPDDPRLTAYALGELSGDERAAIEAALRRNPALRAAVDEIRATASQIEAALAAEASSDEFALPEIAPRVNGRGSSHAPARPLRPAAILPGDDPNVLDGGDYRAPRQRGKIVKFPQFYYVVGGLAAACLFVAVSLHRERQMFDGPVIEGAVQSENRIANASTPQPAASPAAQAASERSHVIEVPLAAPVTESVATTANSAANVATTSEPQRPEAQTAASFVDPDLTLLGQSKRELEGGAAANLQEARLAAGHDAAAAAPTAPAEATASHLAEPHAEPNISFDIDPHLAHPTTPRGNGFRGFEAPPTAGMPAPTMAARGAVGDPMVARSEKRDSAREASSALPVLEFGASMRPEPRMIAPHETAARSSTDALRAARSDEPVQLEEFRVSVDRWERPSPAFQATRRLAELESLPRPPRGAKFSRNHTEAYAYIRDNEFVSATLNPFSTFAADVDTASYSNVRRFIEQGRLPPRDAVRIEEMLNYFPYRYPAPKEDVFAATLEVTEAPWAPAHRLVRIGLKGRDIPPAERPAANLVFLIDVSDSMDTATKLPLAKDALRMLVRRLRADDRVAIVTYAGRSGIMLDPTPAARSHQILDAIDQLTAGGAGSGTGGIQRAYELAETYFARDGINRVILCTDGDFNLGASSEGELVRLIQQKAASGVFLTVLGFGMGNLKDATLEKLAQHGNGTYGYIDSRREAEKLLVEQVSSTLVAIAKDVKVQVEFNPSKVAHYRLIGYENRLLRREDFNSEEADGGEIGAGHTLTALYEVVPVGVRSTVPAAAPELDESRYAADDAFSSRLAMPSGDRTAHSDEMLFVKVRYKKPDGMFSRSQEFPLEDKGGDFAAASADFRFAAAVAQFGMILRDSPHKGAGTMGDVLAWAASAARTPADDPGGYRGEFIDLVRKAQQLLQ